MNGLKTNKTGAVLTDIPVLSERLIGIFLILFAVFSPVSIAGTHIAWSFAVLFWLVKSFSNKNIDFKRTPLDIPLLIFFAVILLSIITSVNIKFSMKGIKSAIQFIIFFLVVNNVKDIKQIKRIISVLIIFTTISAAYGIFQHYTGIDFLRHNEFLDKILPRATGFYGIPMTFAEHISMALMIVAGLLLFSGGTSDFKSFIKKNAVLILSLSIIAAGLYFSFTRGAWVGSLAGLLFLLFLKSRKIFIIGIISMVIITASLVKFCPDSRVSKRLLSITDKKDISVMKRFFIWESSLDMFRAHPVTGIGWECYRKVYPDYVKYRGRKWRKFTAKAFTHAHNNFLNIAVETGIIGLGVFIWIMIIIFRESAVMYRRIKDKYTKSLFAGIMAALIVFVISGMTEYTFGDSEITMLLYFLLGLAFSIRRLELSG